MKNKLLFILISVNTAILIYLLNFNLIAFNENYYFDHFEENNIYEKNDNADEILVNLLSYYKDKGSLNESYFTVDEVSHLRDVKNVINKTQGLFHIVIILEIILIGWIPFYIENKYKFISPILIYSGLATILITVILFLASLNFSSLFFNFHLLFFPQGNFFFPENSILITLFPEVFFYKILSSIVLKSIIIAVFLTTIGLLLFVTNKQKIYHKKV